MAANTGRTPSKFLRFIIDDSAGTLREVPANRIGNIGLTYPEVDLSAFQDAVSGFLQGRPDFALEFGGAFDTVAAAAVAASGAAPVLSGSHTVLQPITGLMVPLSWGVYFGVRHYWETGEPVFGISSSATSGMLLFDYQVVPGEQDLMYSAKLRLYPGSSAPAWGTSAIT